MELFFYLWAIMRKSYIVILLFFAFTVSGSNPIKIAVISDIHYLSSALVGKGEAYKRYIEQTGREIEDLHPVLDFVLSEIKKEKPDILLISGDLTNHGEAASHKELISKLKPLQHAGIRILIVPGNHDINIPDSKSFLKNRAEPAKTVTPQEFEELYSSFGFADAINRDENSLSYLAEINKETWILCFDTNRYKEHEQSSISAGRIKQKTMSWALRILEDAQMKNIEVLGMMHHGIVEHLPYQSNFFSDYLIDDWEQRAQILADAGLQVVFTGHFHANDISLFKTEKGNILYDVETGSLAQYPFPYRFVELDGKRLSIKTDFIDSISSNPNLHGKYRERFEQISKRVISSRIKNMGMPLLEEVQTALTDLLVYMSLLHVSGDEEKDPHLLQLIERLAEVTGDDGFDSDTFQLDFPPADNDLTIYLK